MLKKVFLIFLLNIFAFSGLVFAIPNPTGFVNDFEGIIENKSELEQKLSNFEKETSIEIVVLTTPDFEETYIEDYAVQVFEKWGVGKEGQDNGVLLIVSKQQKQSRIEVGYGLEGVLTDSLTGRIQDSAMIPSFQQDNFSQGINEGVDAIISVLEGEEFVETTVAEDEEAGFCVFGLILLGFLILIANPFVAAAIGGISGFLAGSVFGGPSVGVWTGILGALIGFVIGLISKAIPAPIRYGIARTMVSSGRGASSGGGFGGFGGGSSGGGGSSRSW